MTWIIIIIFLTAIDQITKFLVQSNIEMYGMIPVIDRFFYLTNVVNKGAAWSILQNGRYFFLITTTLLTVILFYILFKTKDKFLKFILSLILGGAIGNFIDRLIKGGVTDFLDFHFGSYNFPTFNIADTSIVVGSILLVYYMLFIYKEPVPKSKQLGNSDTDAAEDEDGNFDGDIK